MDLTTGGARTVLSQRRTRTSPRSGWSGCCGCISSINGMAWPKKLCENQALRGFAPIDLSADAVPDAGYTGAEKRPRIVALERKNRLADGGQTRADQKHGGRWRERSNQGHRKFMSPGLGKNGHQLYTLFGLVNVVIGSRTVAT